MNKNRRLTLVETRKTLRRIAPPTTGEMLTYIESRIPDVLQRKDRIEAVRSADRVSSAAAIKTVYRQLGGV